MMTPDEILRQADEQIASRKSANKPATASGAQSDDGWRDPWSEAPSTPSTKPLSDMEVGFDTPARGLKGWKSGSNSGFEAPKPSAFESVKDSAIALGTGVTQGLGMLANVAGADNAASRTMADATQALSEYESPYRKAEKQERARKIKEAEESGSTLKEVGAYLGSFAEAPIDTTLNALGTSLPTLAAGFIPGAGQAAVAARVAQAGLGAAQGIGAVKGQIFDEVKQAWKEKGATEEDAAARAAQAQSYTGDNAGSIALGGAFGTVAGSYGAEASVRRLVGKEVAERAAQTSVLKGMGMGALKEAPMEGLQGGQERLASNLALQNEGFDQGTWTGVAGGAALEATASAPMGAGFGAWEAGSQQRLAQQEQQRRAEIERQLQSVPEHQQPAARAQLTAELNAQLQAEARAAGLMGEEQGPPDAPAGNPNNYRATPSLAKPPEDAATDYGSPDDEILQSTGRPVAPVRDALQQSADAGGALSTAALVAIDNGAAPTFMPPPLEKQPQEQQAEPVVLQNRDRTSQASISQMQSIAAAPDYIRAGPSAEMATGAPVVFGDLPSTALLGRNQTVVDGRGTRVATQYAIVDAGDLIASNNADGTPVAEYAHGLPGKLRAVAGNGRTAGLQAAYQMGTAQQSYTPELLNSAQELGIDRQAVAAMKRPVLVRLMDQKDVTPDMGDRTNITGTQKLSPVEQAANDARRFDITNLAFDEGGNPTAKSIAGFVSSMPVSEQGDMMNPDGSPTRQAVDRLMAATFKQAYDSDELVQLYAQAADPDARAVLSAAADASGVMAALSGTEFDVRQAVADAVKMAVNASRQGLKLSDVLQNADFDMNPEAYPVATFLAKNIRSPKAMAEGLRRWGQLALQQARVAEENKYQGNLLGDPTPTLSRQEILARIGDAYNPTEQAVAGRAQPQAEQASIESAPPAPLMVPGNFGGTPAATIGTRMDAVAGPGFGPASLKDALAQIRARKQTKQPTEAKTNAPTPINDGAQAAPTTSAQNQAQAPAAPQQTPTWATMPTEARQQVIQAAGLNKPQATKALATNSIEEMPAAIADKLEPVLAGAAAETAPPEFSSFETKTALLRNSPALINSSGDLNERGNTLARTPWRSLSAQDRAMVQQLSQDKMASNNAYNAYARKQEFDAERRRLQSDRIIQQANGKPFKKEASAQAKLDEFDLADTHAIQKVDGGYVLRQMPPAEQAEVLRKAEGRESYTEAQAAVLAEMGIGENADGEIDATDEQFNEIERRVAQRLGRNLPTNDSNPNQPPARDQQAQAATETVASDTLELTAPTAADIEAQQAQQQQAANAEAARQRAESAAATKADDRKRIAQASVAAADSFELGQDPMQNITGQGSLLDAPGQPAAQNSKQNQPPAKAQQAQSATENVAQPVTRADVEAAQQQAAAIIGARIDAMSAGDVNKIAKKFLPTMGMKPTMSKANNKAAMTDPKINLEAAAAEVGAVLPAEVTHALQADMEGHVVDAAKPAAPAQQEASKPKKLPPFPVDGYRLEGYYANGAKVKPLPAKAFSPTEVQAITDWFKSIGWSVTSGSGANGVNATNDVGMTVDDLPEPYTAAQRKKDEAQKAADERAADKKNAQDDYLASNDAGKFVSDMFGDSMNRFNLTALAKVLAGDEKTFGGLFSNRAADVLADAGISTEGRQVKDIVADIKATFDAAQQDAKNPARAAADGLAAAKQEPGKRIEDFGEKLEGARKDLPPSLKEEVSDEQMVSLPLSKIWPANAHEEIQNDAAAALAFAARQEIPAKPRQSVKVQRWVQKVKNFRALVTSDDALAGNLDKLGLDGLSQRVVAGSALEGFFAKVRLLAQLPRDTWGRVEKVGEYPDAVRYGEDGKKTPAPFSAVVIDGEVHQFDGAKSIGPDEVSKIKELLVDAAPKKGGLTAEDFEIRTYKNRAESFINRKGDKEMRPLKTFTGQESGKQAREWLKANVAQAEAQWEAVKARDNVGKSDVRTAQNRQRVGADHRKGADVTAQMFEDAFGFRGVQFGNWVAQGAGAKDRQGLLNEAYDALMDLSLLLGVPSRAMSLDGSLGLSLGARGSGKAAAHFEPDSLVINLTKTKGAGSLAHEWFHALDNYFRRQRGGMDKQAGREDAYITYKPEAAWVPKAGTRRAAAPLTSWQLRQWLQARGMYDSGKSLEENAQAANFERDPQHKDGVRPQVEAVFAQLVQALNDSPMAARATVLDGGAAKGYWGRIIERGARSFENYVINKMALQGYSNDFLANIRSFDEWQALGKNAERYPYLTPAEEGPVVEAFDNLFGTIETRQGDDGNVELYYAGTEKRRPGTAQDKAVMQAIADGKSARDVLRLVANGSKDPFLRQVARLLLKAGITPNIQFGYIGKTEKGDPIHGQYRGKSDTIAIAGSAEYAAERIFMHEAMHAATMRALAKPGLPKLQMQKLLEHVRKQPGAAGFYGTKNVDEFVVEAFTNPDFQAALRKMNAPSGSSGIKTAWDGFVRILRSILGLKNDPNNALSQALELGVAAMREDMNLRKQGVRGAGRANAGADTIDQTETEAFKRWFKDSKAVDAEGKPLVVYHGTNADFNAFDPGKLGMTTGAASASYGFFFASNPKTASYYATGNPRLDDLHRRVNAAQGSQEGGKLLKQLVDLQSDIKRQTTGQNPITQRMAEVRRQLSRYAIDISRDMTAKQERDEWGHVDQSPADERWQLIQEYKTLHEQERAAGIEVGIGENGRVIPVYLSIKNPLVYDYKGRSYRDKSYAEILQQAINGGHDGVILRNTYDSGPITHYARDETDIYVAFEPTQVKSATGNNGNFDPANQDIRRSFAGQQAATADTMALATAQQRLEAGEDAETVRQETGWHKGADGKWRFEINDADARLKVETPSAKRLKEIHGSWITTSEFMVRYADTPEALALRTRASLEQGKLNDDTPTLSDVIDHPALFAAYPALADMRVTIYNRMPIGEASFSPDSNAIILSPMGGNQMLSVLLHEIQHGIQTVEGFARGGNPNEFRDESADAEMLRDGAILAVMMRSQGTIEKAKALFVQRFKREPAFGAESVALSGESPESLRSRADNALSPQERYRRLAGEVEARNTQARQNLTDAQRRATPPSQTADVADSDVIVMFNGKVAMSAPTPANAAPDAAPQPPRTPAATIRAAINRAYGKLLGQLEAKGLVTLAQTEAQAIEAAAQARAKKTGGDVAQIKRSLTAAMQGGTDLDVKRSNGAVQGFFDPQTGQSFLIADNLSAEAAPGVLMHEVGIHMAADGSMKALFNRAALMLKAQKADPFMRAVQAKLDAAGETSPEEVSAYLVEAYENQRAQAPASVKRWLADLLATVKAWLYKKGIVGADSLTVADVAAVARANAKSMARGGAGGGVKFSRTGGTDQTMTDAFKRWFAGSKAVDADGKPLVLYHGTESGGFTIFGNSGYGKAQSEKGFWFSDFSRASEYAGSSSDVKMVPELRSWDDARRYAESVGLEFSAAPESEYEAGNYFVGESITDSLDEARDVLQAAVEDQGASSLYQVYLNIKNPKIIDAKGKRGINVGLDVEALKAKGFDGAIIKNIDDPGRYGDFGYVADNYVAFYPEQIKSATGNNGNFDPTNPDIRFSRASQAINNALNERKTVMAGPTIRAYTPEQQAAMRNVGLMVEQPSLKERAQALWQDAGKKLAQGIVDQFAPVKEISKDAYALLRLSKGASGAFETLLKGGKLKLSGGVYDFDEANKGGVVDALLTPLNGEHHDFLRWVAANRAERLMGEDRERLFTPEDIAALKTLADGNLSFDFTLKNGPRKGKTTRNRAEAYKDSLTTFNAFNKNVLDMAEQSGLIDPESRATWESEFYVPFYRVADEESGGVRGMNIKGSVVRQQAFKHLKGGKQALNNDLLDNTLMNWAHLLDASAKNRAAKATLEAAQQVGAAIEAPKGTLDSIASSIGKKNGIVWFMDGGQKRHFMVDDPYLMTAISSLEYAGMNSPIMTAMGAFKHALTIGVTASPFFKIRNLIRDSVQVVGTSSIGTNPLKNVADGWKLTDPKNDAYFRLLAGGGTIHFGTMLEGSEAKRVQALVESGVQDSTILNTDHKVKQFYRKYIEPGITAYNELGNRGEAVNRAALYDQLRKQGVGHAEASLQARDLMDFSMQGSFTSIRFLSQVVPFLNARLQGMYKLGRAANENPKRMAYVTGAVAMASLALLAAYGDDDDWKRREDWDRNNFWWFKVGGIAFRIPKPFELGAIGTLAERSAEYLMDDEMTGKRFRGQVLKLLGDNLSMNPIPQAVKPLLDVYANKDSFRNAPIESMGMERMKPEYRFNDRTSMVARGLSTAANSVTGLVGADALSPVQIDHLLRGYFGWLGTFAVGAADMIARPVTNQPTQATQDIWKKVTGGIASQLEDAPSRYVSSVYDQAKELEQAYGTWRALQKSGKPEEAAAFFADNREEIARYRSVTQVKSAESKLNERIRQIERNEAMDGDQKREEIRRIRAMKEALAKQLAPA